MDTIIFKEYKSTEKNIVKAITEPTYHNTFDLQRRNHSAYLQAGYPCRMDPPAHPGGIHSFRFCICVCKA